MSESVPPPPAASLRGHLRQVASTSRFVAALLVTAVSIRFAIAGVHHALGVSGANFADKPAPHTPAEPSARPRPTLQPVGGGPPAVPTAAPLPAGRPLRVTLGVNYGAPRSEVYVNGSLVGQTPFLGDTSCKSGQSIRIEVVQPTGAPLTYLRDCRGSSLGINGPPP
jgi:hypothetical protein